MIFFRRFIFAYCAFLFSSTVSADIHSTQYQLANNRLLQQVRDPQNNPYAQYVLQQTGIPNIFYAIHPLSKEGHFFIVDGLEYIFENGIWYEINDKTQHMKKLDGQTMQILQKKYLEPALRSVKPLHIFSGTQAKREPLFLLLPFPCTADFCSTFLETLSTLEKEKKLTQNIHVLPLLEYPNDSNDTIEQLKRLWCLSPNRTAWIQYMTQPTRVIPPPTKPEQCKSVPLTNHTRLFERIFQVPKAHALFLNFADGRYQSQRLPLDSNAMASTLRLLLEWLAKQSG